MGRMPQHRPSPMLSRHLWMNTLVVIGLLAGLGVSSGPAAYAQTAQPVGGTPTAGTPTAGTPTTTPTPSPSPGQPERFFGAVQALSNPTMAVQAGVQWE